MTIRGAALTRFTVLAAGVALGVFAEWEALQRGPLEEPVSGAAERLAAADLVTGLVLVACGVLAWRRRPDSLVGIWLTVAGFAWFLGTFAASGNDAVAGFGALFVTLHRGPLVHALLSYPTGRLEGRLERGVVALAYVDGAVADVGASPEVTIALMLLVLGVAVRRTLTVSGPLRHARRLGLAAAVAFATVLLVGAFASTAGAGESVDRGVLWAYQAVVVGMAIALTTDLLLGRWTEAAVTGLVVDLGELGEAGTLRDRLADALGDRSLVVGFWLPERDVFVDDRGREVQLPEPGSDRRVAVVRDGGAPVAALIHDASVLADEALLDSVSSAARIAVSNVRLQAEIRRQVEAIAESRRRIVEAGDSQRRRLERELRQGAERRLERVKELLPAAAGGEPYAAVLAETRDEVGRAQDELRELARGIHPRALTDGGLRPALTELAGRSALPVDLVVPDERFPEPVEAAAYFVCSEALANVGKYAEASRVSVEAVVRDETLSVSVRDDGSGGANLEKGSGLRGLADRAEALGGRLEVDSPPGAGTRLVAELPLT